LPCLLIPPRYQSQVAGHLLATRKAANISYGQDKGKCCHRPYSGLAHQQMHVGILLSHLRYCIVEGFQLTIQHSQ